MSETSNGVPDLTAADNEPSMEDILSSIRKIIADDKTEDVVAVEAIGESSALEDSALGADALDEPFDLETLEIPTDDSPDDIALDTADPDVAVLDIIDAPVLEEEAPVAVETPIETPRVELPESNDDEILELINFAIAGGEAEAEEIDIPPQEIAQAEETLALEDEILTIEEPMVPNVSELEPELEPIAAFDESLDLVMDSDASDYMTTQIVETEAAEITQEVPDLDVPDVSELDVNLEQVVEARVADVLEAEFVDEFAPTLEEKLAAAKIDPIPREIGNDAEFTAENTDVELEDLLADIGAELEAEPVEAEEDNLNTEAEALEDIGAASTSDQDMDLVKSLLEDLMDEPELEEDADLVDQNDDLEALLSGDEAIDVQQTVSEMDVTAEEEQEAESILDDILYQSLDDETKLSEDSTPDVGQSSISNEESELAQIARSAQSALEMPEIEEVASSNSDTVILPERDLSGTFSLMTKSAAAAAVAVTVSSAMETENVEDDPDGEAIQEVVAAADEIETSAGETSTDTNNLQEEDMVQAVKSETLLDTESEKETSDAFAALTSVVKEQADLAESGPPIGDLVQEALRPMLKEWLDKNLKGIVERAVSKEVKRISSGK